MSCTGSSARALAPRREAQSYGPEVISPADGRMIFIHTRYFSQYYHLVG
jgi:hypothetical protein